MNKVSGTISLVIALFLLVSMLMKLDTWVVGIIAIVALVVLAAFQFARTAPGQK